MAERSQTAALLCWRHLGLCSWTRSKSDITTVAADGASALAVAFALLFVVHPHAFAVLFVLVLGTRFFGLGAVRQFAFFEHVGFLVGKKCGGTSDHG